MYVCECLFEEDEEINPMWSQNHNHDAKKHLLTYYDNSNTDRELWICICEPTQSITASYISSSCSNISDTAHHRLGRAARCPHPFVLMLAQGSRHQTSSTGKSNIWTFHFYSTAVWIGWERVWLPDRRNTESRLWVSREHSPWTAVGNKSLKSSKTALWQILSKH